MEGFFIMGWWMEFGIRQIKTPDVNSNHEVFISGYSSIAVDFMQQ